MICGSASAVRALSCVRCTRATAWSRSRRSTTSGVRGCSTSASSVAMPRSAASPGQGQSPVGAQAPGADHGAHAAALQLGENELELSDLVAALAEHALVLHPQVAVAVDRRRRVVQRRPGYRKLPAAVGGDLVHHLAAADQLQRVEPLAQLARLGVAEEDRVAEGQLAPRGRSPASAPRRRPRGDQAPAPAAARGAARGRGRARPRRCSRRRAGGHLALGRRTTGRANAAAGAGESPVMIEQGGGVEARPAVSSVTASSRS